MTEATRLLKGQSPERRNEGEKGTEKTKTFLRQSAE